jgi:RNA polymerase sigma factor (sigma-70 family)
MADPFPQTRWSLVLQAQDQTNESTSVRALDELCRAYWLPLYSYARRRGLNEQDAEDATQGFFATLLQRSGFDHPTPEKGRMRAFLLTALKRYLTNQWRLDSALKRGGGQTLISFDIDDAEGHFARAQASTDDTPETAFDKAWAHTLLSTVFEGLETHYANSGQTTQFEALRPFLIWGDKDQSHADIAIQLGMSEGSVRSAIHRMRARYRSLLEAEIRQTVTSSEEAATELNHLKKVLAGG